MSKKYFNDELGSLVLSTFSKFNDSVNKVLETENLEPVQVVGLLQESDPELKHAEGFGDEESDGLDEDDDDNEDETNESDDDNDEESVDEIPTKGAIVKSSHRETFDMDDRDDDSYYTVSSGKSAEHDGAADESVTARLPPEPTSARLPLPLSLSNPNVVTDASEKIEDEWENDDDNGYVTISISTEKFFDMEESCATKVALEEDLRLAAEELAPGGVDQATSMSGKGVLARAAYEGLDDDLLAATEYLKEPLTNVPEPPAPVPSSTVLTGSEASSSKQITARSSAGETRRAEIMGQHQFGGMDGKLHSYFNLKVIFEPHRTGFEESKHFNPAKGSVIAGRYEVADVLGQAAFSTALQCADLVAEPGEPQWVCLKVIKNNKDFFDQSMDEIKLLQYINSSGDSDKKHVLRLIDFFYYKEHLFIVSELLRENLYEFGRYVRDEGLEPYYTMPRLKKIMKQVLSALAFIHSLHLIHCDVKPENIVIKSYSRCEVKLIDFGSSCFATDNLTTYIQSRSYRAPEVIIGHHYDGRIDVWSMGAVLAELFTGYVLFQNDSVPAMLARISSILGPIPQEVLNKGRESFKYYSSSSVVYEKTDDQTVSLFFPKQTTLAARLHLDAATLSQDETQFVDFVGTLLGLDPSKRVTAAEALQHKWLEDADKLEIPAPNLVASK